MKEIIDLNSTSSSVFLDRRSQEEPTTPVLPSVESFSCCSPCLKVKESHSGAAELSDTESHSLLTCWSYAVIMTSSARILTRATPTFSLRMRILTTTYRLSSKCALVTSKQFSKKIKMMELLASV